MPHWAMPDWAMPDWAMPDWAMPDARNEEGRRDIATPSFVSATIAVYGSIWIVTGVALLTPSDVIVIVTSPVVVAVTRK